LDAHERLILRENTSVTIKTARRVSTTVAIVVTAMFGLSPGVGERVTGETRAITALKSIEVAEMQFASLFGHYDTLDCLAQLRCLPESAAIDDPFLSPQWAADLARHGYEIKFSPGPSAWDPSVPERSRSALARFAVAAVPAATGSVPRRAFCLDETGTIYTSPAGTIPRVEGGRCVDVGNPIR
jgi:hypothetical protein